MNKKVLSFYVDNWYLGLEVTLVKEINRNVEYSQVPDAPQEVVGLMNVRGQIVTLFDLVTLLNNSLEESQGSLKRKKACIILKGDGYGTNQVGFLVDSPGEVMEISLDQCKPPPANLQGIDVSLLKNVVEIEQRLLLILDLTRLVEQ